MSNITGYTLRQAHEAPWTSLLKRIYDYASEISGPVLGFKAVSELGQLSDRQLRDIGVERRHVERIADREIAKLRTK